MRIYSYDNSELNDSIQLLADSIVEYLHYHNVLTLYGIQLQSRHFSYATYRRMIMAATEKLITLHITSTDVHNVIDKAMDL